MAVFRGDPKNDLDRSVMRQVFVIKHSDGKMYAEYDPMIGTGWHEDLDKAKMFDNYKVAESVRSRFADYYVDGGVTALFCQRSRDAVVCEVIGHPDGPAEVLSSPPSISPNASQSQPDQPLTSLQPSRMPA